MEKTADLKVFIVVVLFMIISDSYKLHDLQIKPGNRNITLTTAIYPRCPRGAEIDIAEHACLKHSGRIGRSAAARQLENEAVRLAVIAHIRHVETKYDELLARGHDRWDARAQVKPSAETVLSNWSNGSDS